MADPLTWSVVLGGIGAATSAAGAIGQGAAASRSASYQAQVARNNAIISEQNARYATAAGEAKSLNQSMKSAADVGKAKVAQAANGIDVNSGSAVKVRAGDAEVGKLDTLTTMNDAALKAYGYRANATNDTAQAGLDQATADSALPGAILGASGSLLGSASSLGFKWAGAQQNITTPGMTDSARATFNPDFTF